MPNSRATTATKTAFWIKRRSSPIPRRTCCAKLFFLGSDEGWSGVLKCSSVPVIKDVVLDLFDVVVASKFIRG